ncbi:MAG: thioredoxin domain-containing protein [Deltaproteobacteria bacterium]|nr:thioredoxin domain-containing protein [Deltaproteobacteria bacterium]
MRKKWLTAVFISALLGIVIASISAGEYFHVRKNGFEEASFCSINEVVNCDIINASSYSEMAGVPVAAWGILFYIIIGCYAFFVRSSKQQRFEALSFASALSFIGLLWTVRMAYASVFTLHAVCITCAAQYALNLFIFIALLAGGSLSIKERIALALSKKMLPHLLTAGIIFGIGYVFSLSAAKGATPELSAFDIKEVVNAHFRQSLYDIKPQDLAKAPIWGNKDAKVTIAEFSDFQCPFCRVAAFNVRPFLHEFRDKVKFAYLNYPLDNSCNQYMQGPMHQNACLAAKAAVCANEKEKFWEYHDDIFKNQQKLSRELLMDLAGKHGIDKEWMGKCMDSDETLARVKEDIEVAHHIYLSGTPSIFINQRLLRAWRSPEALRNIVREEIKRAK